ncbi:putative nucleotide-binding protein; predicted ATPase or kinase [Candidatus Blochmanniella floridana]|uniref:tRNA threonylcarbamoyladenosine biosynthesis protein TsaE n=1 Tax=Blochmanniella floridana TaxID=203907 RepID=Q7VQP6_BLOFL|nr:putative nucleotide-binding protein; predicted ATPase or kinase [Candidatus Blochmannia floridanus]
MEQYVLILSDKSQMLLLGLTLAKVYYGVGYIVYLNGDVGVGKSTLCAGFLRALGYAGYVNSPTYTLIEFYFLSNRYIYHVDFYRLHSDLDVINTGIQDYFDKQSTLLIEWPKREMSILPAPDVIISINYYCNLKQYRQVIIQSGSDLGQKIIDTMLRIGRFTYEIKI